MRKKWQNLRVEADVHARLSKYAESVSKAKHKALGGRAWLLHKPISLGEAVARLLDQVEAHRERSKRAQRKRKAPAAHQAQVGANGSDQAQVEVNGITSNPKWQDLPPAI